MKVLFAYDGSECAEAAIDDLHRAGLPEKTRLVVLSIEEDWQEKRVSGTGTASSGSHTLVSPKLGY